MNIVPAVAFGDSSSHKALGVGDAFPVNNGADTLHFDVSWKPGCMGTQAFTLGAKDDEKKSHCTTRFQSILDGVSTTQ